MSTWADKWLAEEVTVVYLISDVSSNNMPRLYHYSLKDALFGCSALLLCEEDGERFVDLFFTGFMEVLFCFILKLTLKNTLSEPAPGRILKITEDSPASFVIDLI